MNLTPVSAVCRNPLVWLRPGDFQPVKVGLTIAELEPASCGGLIVCRFNGEWLLREHWGEVVKFGDRLEWHEYPQGREAVRVILQLALVASLFFPGAQFLGYGITAELALLNVAFNLLVPPRQPNAPNAPDAPGSVFGTSLAGNAARLDEVIWKICGRVKITPPFAAQPYTQYLASDVSDPYLDTDQYFYAIFALGIGFHDLEKSFIGKTSVSHFRDVQVARYLGPGEQPTVALANVVTSDEVSTSLELFEGLYVGGYAASRPGDTVTAIGIDITAPQGVGTTTDPLTLEWQVEAREIDQYGRAAADWQIIANESRTAYTNTPQRWTNNYLLSTPIRCEVRVVRTNIKNTDANARDGIQWTGLRAFLSKPAPLNPHAAHFEVVMRASEQLSSFSQRDFSMIVRGKCRTWDPETGWSVPVFTRNPMWWLADLWTNPVWGEGLPDDRVDLQGLWEIAQTLDARQDHFDYAITSAHDSWEMAQLIAHSARCRAFRKGGVYTCARDEEVAFPVTAFTSRNTQPKSMVLTTALPKREQADGVIVQYQSNVVWDTATIECPAPGFTYSDSSDPRFTTELPAMENPIYISLDGVTGAKHAEREGMYQAASLAYRTATVSAKVEMEGVIVSFMDPIRWQPQIHGYGQTGDVAFWDPDTLVMGLTEPPDFSQPQYLTLQRDDGSLTDPVLVLPGPTANDVTLPEPPDFDLAVDDGLRERPKYLLGPLTTGDELVKITEIKDGGKTDGGAQLYDIEAVIDDDRVHLADNALLPGPGEIQDPIDDGSDVDEDEGGNVVLARLIDHYQIEVGTDTYSFGLNSLGHLTYGATTFPNEWLAFAAEPDDIAEFEVYVHLESGSYVVGSALDTWLPMTADYTWGIDGSMVGVGVVINNVFDISIRRIGTTPIQASSTFTIQVGQPEPGGGT